MPSMIETILSTAVIVIVSVFWSALTAIAMFLEWWKDRGNFFVTKKHPRPAVLDQPDFWTHHEIQLEKIKMHYVEAGDPDQPLMLFVHGFPEFWYSWRFQLKHFQKDYHVVAVDLRGYNDTDKPENVSNYDIELLVADIAEVIHRLGNGKAILVGHDWGAAIAWALALEHPDLLYRLIILNVPHPSAMKKLMQTRPKQFLMSWYMFMFQCPWLTEIRLWAKDYAFIENAFRSKGKIMGWDGKGMGLQHQENMTDEDIEAFKYVFSKPNGLTPPLNIYRAEMRMAGRRQLSTENVTPKTLIIWGDKDGALDVEGAVISLKYCTDARLERIPDAAHWVQQDTPEKVNELIEKFLNETN